ncbi:autotransporter outer membrane beta-barrel domain-containing protein [Salmonella enterica]|nr:autotransporter outer membrane beta-barrel domain-containing protein [Salmonella enterica]
MNITHQFINQRISKIKTLSFIIGGLLSTTSYASLVGTEIPYQTYRDFSENKGAFQPGAENVIIYAKDGNEKLHLNKAPMPDFSSIDRKLSVTTLIAPNYVAGVSHNSRRFNELQFGNEKSQNYLVINENPQPARPDDYRINDFHLPRLSKIVTETSPLEITSAGMALGTYQNKERFPALYRIGTGVQYMMDKNGKAHQIASFDQYRTGGILGKVESSSHLIAAGSGKTIYDEAHGGFYSYGTPGDSGSPLIAWDTRIKKWILAGVLSRGGGIKYGLTGNWWVVPHRDFVNEVLEKSSDGIFNFSPEQGYVFWTADPHTGLGHLTQGELSWKTHGRNNSINVYYDNPYLPKDLLDPDATRAAQLDAGKDLIFGHSGTIELKNSIDQGAGTLTFNGHYTLKPTAHETWMGGGVIVNGQNIVNWQVNGVEGDTLHKLGTGTLNVSATGINYGNLNVGDGEVILAQKPDDSGRKQAFSAVTIVSGRPTVKINDATQVNPDNIVWGFRGGKLDLNGNEVTFHRLRGADNGAVLTNTSEKKSSLHLEINPKYTGSTLWHGQFTGNTDVYNQAENTVSRFVSDGGMNINGNFSQENGRLVFQGHPVTHAATPYLFSPEWGDDRTKDKIQKMVLKYPTDFSQPDWETRQFSMNNLILRNSEFQLSRNAQMSGNIDATHSTLTLGSPDVWIDHADGTGREPVPVKGISVPHIPADISRYQGNILLRNQSALDIRNSFSGSVAAQSSRITISSPDVSFSEYSGFSHTPLSLEKNSGVVASAGWFTDSAIFIGEDASLTLKGTSVSGHSNSFIPVTYVSEKFTLTGKNASLNMLPGAFTSGDIDSDTASSIIVGGKNDAEVAADLNPLEMRTWRKFNGFRNVFQGEVNAPKSTMSVNDSRWQVSGQSRLNNLNINRSMVALNGRKWDLFDFHPTTTFNSLTVDNLMASQSAFLFRTDLKNSDKLVINGKAEGSHNQIFVDFIKKPRSRNETLSVPLVTAPVGTNPDLFKAAELSTGFSRLLPVIHTQESDGQIQWLLDGYKSATNHSAETSATSFMTMGYKNFMTEVNNLNKRMGDLRNSQGEDGVWVRILNGAGTGETGYSDRYTHLQTGFDKKHRLEGADLFTGLLMSYTDSHASGREFAGETHSFGSGLYASVMGDSGVYLDMIGKYLHHSNDYSAAFAGMGKQHYATHSWYAGLEGGYRYPVTDTFYLEPQTELVYGSVSGKTLTWNDQGMDVFMGNKGYNPLIGRTGLAAGKTFSGTDWNVTLRTGMSWQFDLLSGSETVLRDASGEKRFTGHKDSRMLYSVGMNARMKDNIRFGLEVEQSAFGKYNTDHAINANFRYTF